MLFPKNVRRSSEKLKWNCTSTIGYYISSMEQYTENKRFFKRAVAFGMCSQSEYSDYIWRFINARSSSFRTRNKIALPLARRDGCGVAGTSCNEHT